MTDGHERYLQEVLISEERLRQRIAELGKEITTDYQGCPGLVLVCVLKGGILFLADLMRHIQVPHGIDFLAVSSYGVGARQSQGEVRIMMDLSSQISGQHVLIIEDIIDSGHTLRYVMEMLQARRPASLKLCALLNKVSRRRVNIQVDYTGFEIEDRFVFGYGLDLDERYRNLPFVGVADLSQSGDA